MNRVLIIEDDIELCNLLKHRLSLPDCVEDSEDEDGAGDLAFTADIADSACSGLRLWDKARIEGNSYPLVIMDIWLRDMSGVEMAKCIRCLCSDSLKLAFMTGSSEAIHQEWAKVLHADLWIKPECVERLPELIRAALAKA